MMSFEHQETHRTAQFIIDGSPETANDFQYTTKKGAKLSYGQITALAGDWYDTFSALDNADKNEVVRVFSSNTYLHADDTTSALLKLGWSTRSLRVVDYLKYASTNPEHFRGTPRVDGDYKVTSDDGLPDDSLNTYSLGHTWVTFNAKNAKGPLDQRRMYAVQAFYDHFLTDMFSSGHLRVPRRALSGMAMAPQNVVFGASVPLAPVSIDLVTSKVMHDEDGKTGLWVRNNTTGPWQMFGDGFQVWTSGGTRNWQQCVEAVKWSAAAVTGALGNTVTGLQDPLGIAPKPLPPGAEVHGDSTPTDYTANMKKLDDTIDLDCILISRAAVSEPSIIIPTFLKDAASKISDSFLAKNILKFPTKTLKKKALWELQTTAKKTFTQALVDNVNQQPFPLFCVANHRLYVRLGSSGVLGIGKSPSDGNAGRYVAAEHGASEKEDPPYSFDGASPPTLTVRLTGDHQGETSKIN